MLCSLQLNEKVRILKSHEKYCYQVCHFLLKQEKEAVQAASQTLLELAQDRDFFAMPELKQRERIKIASMKQSIQLKAAQII